jgi:acetyl-CoA synthetase
VYHTGDVGSRDADSYITYVGRGRRVQGQRYRISPFELESVLIEHPAVAEAAIVPSPDPLRLRCRRLRGAGGGSADEETARSILEFARDNLAPYKRIRRLEFARCPRRSPGRSAGWSFGGASRSSLRRIRDAVRRVHSVAATGGARR